MASTGPFNSYILEGSPIIVGGRTLVPQARLVSLGSHRVSVLREHVVGKGWSIGLLGPWALIEHREGPGRTPSSPRRIPIPDATARCLCAMGALAAMVAVFCTLVNALLSRSSTAAAGG
jgi:hypothetical protein